MPAADPNTRAHLEWLGFIQPHGLVVTPPALVKAGAFLNRNDRERQALLAGCMEEPEPADPAEGAPDVDGAAPSPPTRIRDFCSFARTVLGWRFGPKGFAGTDQAPIPEELTLPLPDYGEILQPDYAVRERDPADGAPPWQLLVQVLDDDHDFDRQPTGGRGLDASPTGRAERLLRATGVPAGVLCNGAALRLISAPRGETSGHVDFRFADLVTTAGRPLCSALHLLLSEQRLLALPREKRLAALLADSRLYQNDVSERLAEQVLHALYELLRGFQIAHVVSEGALLREWLAESGDRNEVYRGLLTVILRLVFLLYAEERGMLPADQTFVRYYGLAGLYRRLLKDSADYPDTMDGRYGAWAQLVVLFRLLHDGAPGHRTGGAVSLPERRGALFDPDRYPFLEGRSAGSTRQRNGRIKPPRVPDGTIFRVLDKLLVLDGERLSYRTLDVEQIGSVYETIMGFRLEIAAGDSLAVKPAKKMGAPNTIDLEALLAQPAARRARWLQERVDRTVSESVAKGLRAAAEINDLHGALDRVLDHAATPDVAPRGVMVLQPNAERRRSGSHYTPRELTEPIVRHTLAPLLERLRGEDGGAPAPEQILDLKVCDPAMGSGAFLVETCRQLADALIEAWRAHGVTPEIPPDEDEVVYARRLVAQRCLYGIDRNPMAVDLAKVSLWLSTLARHPLQRPALDLRTRRRHLPCHQARQVAGRGGGSRQRRACLQGRIRRRKGARRPSGGPDHRVSVPPGRPRRSGTARRQRRQELSGQHRPRHGLHLRRHGQERGGVAARRHAEVDRCRRTQPRGDLSLHRRRGAEHQPDTRPSSLRHQFRRSERGGMPPALARLDGDYRPTGQTGTNEGKPTGSPGPLVAVRRQTTGPLRSYFRYGTGTGDL